MAAKKEPTVTLTVRIKQEDKETLQRIAIDEGRTLNNLVRYILEDYIREREEWFGQ